MKRFTVIKALLNMLKPNDVVVLGNPNVASEAYPQRRDGFCFYNNPENCLEFSMGVAMTTDKRVFCIVEDNDILRSADSLLQLAVSELRNLFIIVLSAGRYQDDGGQPNIFNNINAFMGMFFNMGFQTHSFTPYFNMKGPMKEVENIMNTSVGPAVFYVEVTPGIKKMEPMTLMMPGGTRGFSEFVKNTELGTSLNQPRIF